MEINVSLVDITVLGVTLEVIPLIIYYSKETALERVKGVIPYSTIPDIEKCVSKIRNNKLHKVQWRVDAFMFAYVFASPIIYLLYVPKSYSSSNITDFVKAVITCSILTWVLGMALGIAFTYCTYSFLEKIKSTSIEGNYLEVLNKITTAYSASAATLVFTLSSITFTLSSAAMILGASILAGSYDTQVLLEAAVNVFWALTALSLFILNRRRKYFDENFWNRIIHNNLCKDKILATITLQDGTQLTGKLHLTPKPDTLIIEKDGENHTVRTTEIKALKTRSLNK